MTGTWTAQFIHADADGAAKVALVTITAPTVEAARAKALQCAPANEFVLSLHPRSDEQFLGQVRLQAMAAARKGD